MNRLVNRPTRSILIAWYVATLMISAFLVFQVQPLISKMILPWFGGMPAVWATCLVFFQVTLFLGYAYAHLLTKWFPARVQSGVHLLLLVLALLLVPISPDASWRPQGAVVPTWSILALLTAHVGLPYLLLCATAPLLQNWFSRTFRDVSPYRLFALSNLGSLAGLLSYPLLVEPRLSSSGQDALFTLGFCAFALGCGVLAVKFGHAGGRPNEAPREPVGLPAAWSIRAGWLLYPAFASAMLLAVSNHVGTQLGVSPLLWVLPLALYLLSYIVCFACDAWYSRPLYAALGLCGVMLLSVTASETSASALLDSVLHGGVLFAVCMVCHGELARSRPPSRDLTSFYLWSAGGGALGGLVVAIGCPSWWHDYHELPMGLVLAVLLSFAVLFRHARETWPAWTFARQGVAAAAASPIVLFVALLQWGQTESHLESSRNFYGVLRVQQERVGERTGAVRRLVSGGTVQGAQFLRDDLQVLPTTYYGQDSGIGRSLLNFPKSGPRRVGVIGLGCGTLAAYARSDDYFRFYELNPDVPRLARKYFTYLEQCAAPYEIVPGDARLSLESEPAQHFDILVLDAFQTEPRPKHLLTLEAFREYQRHLRPCGVLAVHVSHAPRNLEQDVVRRAEQLGLPWRLIVQPANPSCGVHASRWLLLSRHPRFFAQDSMGCDVAYGQPAKCKVRIAK